MRPAQGDGAGALQALRDEAAGRPRPGPEHQVRQADGGAAPRSRLGCSRRGDPRAPGVPEPGPDAAPTRDPGLRAHPGRGQGHPDPSSGV